MEKKLYWPANLEFKELASATTELRFAIDENGKVIDIEVSMPFHKSFDATAMRIISESPRWKPATSHNRKVKSYRLQPVTFTQTE